MENLNKIGIVLSSLFCFLCLMTKPLDAVIYTVNNLEEAKKYLPLDSIVFFDIERTLLYPKKPMLATFPGRAYFLKNTESLDSESKDKLSTIINSKSEWEPVENQTKSFIQYLQSRNIPLLAVTGRGYNSLIGKLPYHPDLLSNSAILPPTPIEYTLTNLKKLSINFNLTSPHSPRLNELCRNKNSRYEEGIFFLCCQSIGDLIPIFLEYLPEKYSHVVAIVDELEYLEHLDQMLKSRKVSFVGLHYVKGNDCDRSFDERIAKIQLDHLLKTETLLSDEEAVIKSKK